MKIVSVILTAILFFIFVRLLNEATTLYRGYASLKAFGVPIERVNYWEKPYIILSIIYFVIVALSLFFNVKSKYIVNTIVSCLAIIAYGFVITFYSF